MNVNKIVKILALTFGKWIYSWNRYISKIDVLLK